MKDCLLSNYTPSLKKTHIFPWKPHDFQHEIFYWGVYDIYKLWHFFEEKEFW